MSKAFKRHADRLFALYMLSGIVYLVVLALLAVKTLPGFAMQLLFFIDSIMRNATMNILNSSFAESILFGSVTLYLLVVAIRGISKSLLQYRKSIIYIKNINTDGGSNTIFFINDASLSNIFTAGFLHPKIYASKSLINKLSAKQQDAVILHEESHKADLDPLRSLLVTFLNNITPDLPVKSYFMDLYRNTVELKCDEYAENHLNGDKKSLIQALYQLAKSTAQSNITDNYAIQYFNTNIERIPVLVGAQQVSFRATTSLVAMLPLLTIGLLVSVYSLKFYNCAHLVECIEVFVNNVTKNKSNMLCEVHSNSTETSCISK